MSTNISPALVSTDRSELMGRPVIIEEWRGKSTDTKPVRPADRHGSTFYEMDTQEAFMYDGETLSWIPQ